MKIEEFKKAVTGFDCHPEEGKVDAHKEGLFEELGEFFGKRCKAHRKGVEPDRREILLELGDAAFRAVAMMPDCRRIDCATPYPHDLPFKRVREDVSYITHMIMSHEDPKDVGYYAVEILECIKWFCEYYDSTLEEVMQMNVDKLTGRQERGTIIGEGDER